MDNKFTNLDHLNMSEEELFSQIDHDTLASEKITPTGSPCSACSSGTS